MDTFKDPGLILLALALLVSAAIPALLPRARIPGVVVEIGLGILIGPHVLGMVHPSVTGAFLAKLGMAMLFLIAGFEVDPATLKGQPLRLAAWGWVASLALALAAALALDASGLAAAPLLTALALSTTAIGVLMPIFRDGAILGTSYGSLVLAGGVAGEAAPVVALSLVLAGHHAAQQSLIMLGFGVAALAAMGLAIRAQRTTFPALLARTMHSSGQLPMRLAICVLFLFVALAENLNVDLVIGAFVAGLIVRFAMDGDHRTPIGTRIDGIGPAFLIPIFFIASGIRLDVAALVGDWRVAAMVPVYAALMLLARGVPVLLLYRGALPPPRRAALALHLGTQISLVVAIADVAVSRGLMPGGQGAALVGAGMLTTLVFPPLAQRLLDRGEEPRHEAGGHQAQARQETSSGDA